MSVVGLRVSGKFTALDVFFLCETSASSVSLWFVLLKLTTETQRTQRFHREARLDTLNTGLLKYAVFFCAKFESVYIQKELF